ncbi:hypothetical protein [Luteibacter yeojuensis]|uniref:Uncharacterized protein n=1 Tax=Luteibacter yeojuensis TaxID=345309 RepID=A0A7X5QSW8_9GAMM|nr:hypothetical protein [Luteibacter yeojuensis]NID14826.1 hypothetical protein [Luteibacter yeojuensis]
MRFFTIASISLSVLASSTAYAQATATIKVVNLSKEAILLQPISKNDRATLLNAYPQPLKRIESGQTSTFLVSAFQPIASFASVHYGTRGKSCSFLTSYFDTRQWPGAYVPRWNHSAKSSGGARCSSRLVSTDTQTRDWTAEFIFR